MPFNIGGRGCEGLLLDHCRRMRKAGASRAEALTGLAAKAEELKDKSYGDVAKSRRSMLITKVFGPPDDPLPPMRSTIAGTDTKWAVYGGMLPTLRPLDFDIVLEADVVGMMVQKDPRSALRGGPTWTPRLSSTSKASHVCFTRTIRILIPHKDKLNKKEKNIIYWKASFLQENHTRAKQGLLPDMPGVGAL